MVLIDFNSFHKVFIWVVCCEWQSHAVLTLLWQLIRGWQFSVVLDGDALEHFPYKVQLAYMARIGKSNWLCTDFFKIPIKNF